MALTLIINPTYITEDDRLAGLNHPVYPDNLNAGTQDVWNVLLSGISDTLNPVWIDADTIQLQPGWAKLPNNHAVYLDETLALHLSELLDGTESANTLYFLYLEEETDGTLTWFFSSSATVPAGHDAAKTLRLRCPVWNNASSNIQGFNVVNGWYFYDVDIACAGSDATEVQDGAVTTATTDVTCSGFVPTGSRLVSVVTTLVTATSHFVQVKGSSAWTKVALFVANGFLEYRAVLNDSGVFSVKNGLSSVTRISVRGFAV